MTPPKTAIPLDQEEQDLFEALEQMDTKNLPPVTPEQQQLFREAAANFVSKETSLNITMDLWTWLRLCGGRRTKAPNASYLFRR